MINNKLGDKPKGLEVEVSNATWSRSKENSQIPSVPQDLMLVIVCSLRITARGHPARSKSDPLGWRAVGGDRRRTVVISEWRAACAREVLAQ